MKKLLLSAAAAAFAAPALAQQTGAEILGDLPVIGAPQAGGTGFQPAATSLAAELQWLDGFLLVIITFITIFVMGLLLWCIVRYSRKANSNPAQFTHNSPLEVTWTVVPIFILVVIGGFSLPVLFDQQRIPEGDVVVKVTGYQWYWAYEYPEEGIEEFTSYMIGAPGAATVDLLTEEQEELEFVDNAMSPSTSAQLQAAGYSDDLFRLATDTSVVVPVGATVVMQVTAGDVIHSWTIPSFGVKQDGIPGRLAQLWFRAEQEGVYFGQCSELCGIAHAYMPITVKVVSQEKYDAWVEAMKTGDMIVW
ncbi:cytochrome c oxidase subunit II [Jannaschia aquimarina]|uniref:Cytochrome c oxidase subunit 2 n=1 Tax=Jannaschia aquimarina TaxID=935700 RepID=A0A0D1EF55_9RHOB|nr:cytochrome c oxidase subunit II [Jannaschia aquimarina]KIT14545.1 Cytochrome c oxidase subunit 2 precursor [Jannaschia aquimarina]SNT35409.1 cytochrome c oxidase subunit 2 [Jannaschia aquimarina]